jgi:hypothetical protein
MQGECRPALSFHRVDAGKHEFSKPAVSVTSPGALSLLVERANRRLVAHPRPLEMLLRLWLERGRRRVAFAAAPLGSRTPQRLDFLRREMCAAGLHAPTLQWLNPAHSSPARHDVRTDRRPSAAVDAIFPAMTILRRARCW